MIDVVVAAEQVSNAIRAMEHVGRRDPALCDEYEERRLIHDANRAP